MLAHFRARIRGVWQNSSTSILSIGKPRHSATNATYKSLSNGRIRQIGNTNTQSCPVSIRSRRITYPCKTPRTRRFCDTRKEI